MFVFTTMVTVKVIKFDNSPTFFFVTLLLVFTVLCVFSPAVQLLHLLHGVGPLEGLRGGGSSGALPSCSSVDMVHIKDPTVAVDTSLPVWFKQMYNDFLCVCRLVKE